MRVAVTAAPETAERFREALERAGFVPVLLPCVAVTAAPDPVLDRVRTLALTVDWIVVTSARAVQILWPWGGMPRVPVAAVGPRTAEAVGRAGGMPTVVGEGGVEELIRRMGNRISHTTMLYPRAARVAVDVELLLESAGASVITEIVYRTRPVAPPTEPSVPVATFASPSAVTGWMRSRSLEGIVRAALGPTTAAALAAVGHPAQVVAAVPRPCSLAEALTCHLDERRIP